jgi:hypothetical protein
MTVCVRLLVWFLSAYVRRAGYVANAVYIQAKERSKELLDISKAKLDDVDDELRRTFQAMEEVCLHGPFQSTSQRTEWRVV